MATTWPKAENDPIAVAALASKITAPGGSGHAALVRSGSTWAALDAGAPDTEMVVRSDGTISWVAKPEISLAAWGAVGNGSTNDLTALNDALAQATTLGGGVVKAQPGRIYLHNAPVTFTGSRTTLDLQGSTLKLADGSNCNMIRTQGVTGGGRLSNIGLENAVIDRGTNDGAANANKLDAHTAIFRRVDGLRIRNTSWTTTAGKFAILLSDVDGFHVQHTKFDTFSDGIHLHGLCKNGVIDNTRGTTGDDMIAVTPKDWAGYVLDEGDVERIAITNTFPNQCKSCAVRLIGGKAGDGTPYKLRDITVRTVRGSMLSQAKLTCGIWIGDDPADANTTGGLLDKITVEDVSLTGLNSSKPLVNCRTTVLAPYLRFRGLDVRSDVSAVVNLIGLYDTVQVDGVKCITETTHCVGVYLNGATTNVKTLELSNWDMRSPAQGNAFVKADTNGAVLEVLEATNIKLDNVFWVFDLITDTEIHAQNMKQVSGGGLINARAQSGVAADIVVWSFTGNTHNTVNVGTGTPNATVTSKALGLRCSASVLAKNNGDLVYNTNAGHAAGVGPCVSNGTLWKNLYTGATG